MTAFGLGAVGALTASALITGPLLDTPLLSVGLAAAAILAAAIACRRVLESSAEPPTAVDAMRGELTDAWLEALERLLRLAELRDANTGQHIARVAAYSGEIARWCGAPAEEISMLQAAAIKHDVGKIAVPDAVLLKQGPLSEDERRAVQQHCVLGHELLRSARNPVLARAAVIARSHHERYDGSGYPDALAGEAIPWSARVVQLADVYDALRAARPYKGPESHESAVKAILEGDGRTRPEHFDPVLLHHFREHHEALARIHREAAEGDGSARPFETIRRELEPELRRRSEPPGARFGPPTPAPPR